MKHFLLFYETADDYLERRGEFRAAHLALAWEAATRGELVLGGAMADASEGAILLFMGPDATPAEAFARSDPYVANGLIRSWRVLEWSTVIGEQAANPLGRPEAKQP